MRTNIDIDDHFMRQAIKSSGSRTKKAAVEAELRLLILGPSAVSAGFEGRSNGEET